jgi:hypothetical protein
MEGPPMDRAKNIMEFAQQRMLEYNGAPKKPEDNGSLDSQIPDYPPAPRAIPRTTATRGAFSSGHEGGTIG